MIKSIFRTELAKKLAQEERYEKNELRRCIDKVFTVLGMLVNRCKKCNLFQNALLSLLYLFVHICMIIGGREDQKGLFNSWLRSRQQRMIKIREERGKLFPLHKKDLQRERGRVEEVLIEVFSPQKRGKKNSSSLYVVNICVKRNAAE